MGRSIKINCEMCRPIYIYIHNPFYVGLCLAFHDLPVTYQSSGSCEKCIQLGHPQQGCLSLFVPSPFVHFFPNVCSDGDWVKECIYMHSSMPVTVGFVEMDMLAINIDRNWDTVVFKQFLITVYHVFRGCINSS